MSNTVPPDERIFGENVSHKNKVLAAVLCFCFGIFGAHRFYVGRPISAVFQLLTLGGLGIWSFIDFIIILFGEFEDDDDLKLV
ncbi:TM2 domain-containing protein [Teredinibacter franksiae]|jgi:TM2 domain.|uniref:TM2 domain-containing protein n=1 Tax=Teredinibacter franksiae TaxID=2761453 RepID=UPI00162A3CD8|nr:TM2 domain-containing protein [Teredinibacter franksiae]